jgi:hypothetical protein
VDNRNSNKGDHSILNTPIYLIWPLRIPE